MAGGRPTEYTEAYLEKALEYINSCGDTRNDDGKLIKVSIPTKGGLANYLDIHRDTLYDWCDKYPEFSDIMDKCGAVQENRLINSALIGEYNPTIAKVLLTKHGYRDAIDTDMTSKGEKIVMSPEKVALAKEYEEKLKENL